MNSLNRFADPFYCIMRFVVGLMFACHGLDKISRHLHLERRSASDLDAAWRLGGDRLRILVAFGLLTRDRRIRRFR